MYGSLCFCLNDKKVGISRSRYQLIACEPEKYRCIMCGGEKFVSLWREALVIKYHYIAERCPGGTR